MVCVYDTNVGIRIVENDQNKLGVLIGLSRFDYWPMLKNGDVSSILIGVPNAPLHIILHVLNYWLANMP